MILRLCVIGILFTACGGEHNTGFKSGVVTGIPNGEWTKGGRERNQLTGAWLSECQPAGQASSRIEARIYDDRTLILHFYFHDFLCKQPNFEQVIHLGTVPKRLESGDWHLSADEKTVKDVLIVATSVQTARTLSQKRSCGLKRWELNRARSVMGGECFSKGTSIGTYLFRRSRDPDFIQIELPGGGPAIWLGSRL